MSSAHNFTNPAQLYEAMRQRIRLKHYSYRTEQTYVHWVRRFIRFHNRRSPETMRERELEVFLSHLAVNGKGSASTQNQAFNALLFLYREVLRKELTDSIDALRAHRRKRLPVVLSQDETMKVLGVMSGTSGLIAQLLYGSGLRLMECLRLRVKDIDFARNQIIVRDGKGAEDRVTVLPQVIKPILQAHLQAGETVASTVSCPGLWHGGVARCARAQISRGGDGMGVAVCVSRDHQHACEHALIPR